MKNAEKSRATGFPREAGITFLGRCTTEMPGSKGVFPYGSARRFVADFLAAFFGAFLAVFLAAFFAVFLLAFFAIAFNLICE